MKKNSINFIFTIILAILLSAYLPWWSIMIAAFISSSFIPLKQFNVFFVPFLAVTLFWGVYAFWLSKANDFILAKKIAVLLPLQENPYLLILLTACIGGVAAGVTAIFGKQCAIVFKKTA